MTDRLNGLTVHFERPIRDDDAESIINAILMIKGVSRVTTIISDSSDFIVEHRTKDAIRKAVLEVLR